MRPRKAAAAAVVVEEPPPPEDLPLVEELPPPEETVDAIPPDDTGADEAPSAAFGALSAERICIECGSSGGGHDGCAHRERARFYAPPRGAREFVARLRRAAAEHRAAARALRALVMAEHARGRADVETAAPDASEPAVCPRCAGRDEREPAVCPRCAGRDEREPAVCPRCAGRDEREPAETARGRAAPEEAATPEAAEDHGERGEAGGPSRRPKRKGRVPVEQQALPFTRS